MPDLRTELSETLRGRVCFVGVGNVDRGDDGFGVRLAQALEQAGIADVVVAETTPENWIERICARPVEQVVFLDVVQLGSEPGAAVFMNAAEIGKRFPQVSTHKLSLGLLANLIEVRGPQVWLLGVQPKNLSYDSGLSGAVQESLAALVMLLSEVCGTGAVSANVAGQAPALRGE
jgi:hydrogenase maturation protease